MGAKGQVHRMSVTRLVWREWPILFLLMVCIILTTPHYVAAQINESLPPNYGVPEGSKADFVVFGDSQGSFGYVWPVAPNFDNMLRLINEIDVPMAVHLGDFYVGDSFMAMNVDSQAKRFLSDMDVLDITWWPVMGNHDAAGNGWGVTKDIIFQGGNTYYSFDTEDSHFVVLDAFMPGYEHRISKEQLAWLEKDLDRTTKPHIFVFAHAPLYSLGDHFGGSLDGDTELRNRLADMLVEKGVDVFFNGHEHSYASFEYRGLMQITSGGAGGHLRSLATFEELGEKYDYDLDEITRFKTIKTLHYVCVTTTEDQIEISAYDLEGILIDQFTLES